MTTFKKKTDNLKLEDINIAEIYFSPEDKKHPLIRIFHLLNGEKLVVSDPQKVTWGHQQLGEKTVYWANHAERKDPLLKLIELGNGQLLSPIVDLRKGYNFSVIPKTELTEELLI